MLMFLATLGVSAGAALLVQAMDIDCVRPAKPRQGQSQGLSQSLSQGVKTEVTYVNPAIAGALR